MGEMHAPPTSAILARAQSSPTTASGSTQASETTSIIDRRWQSRSRDHTLWRRHLAPLSGRRSHRRDFDTGMSPEQRATSKGYSDGFFTAKIFAQYGMSKLGFTGQYISDGLAKLGPEVVKAEYAGTYQDWFMKGLQDGENIIVSHVTNITST